MNETVLEPVYTAKRERTAARVRKAVQRIGADAKRVTLERIREYSRESGTPTAISTILRNEEAYQVYLSARQDRPKRKKRSKRQRDSTNQARYYYLHRKRKAELVQRLLELEDRLRAVSEENYWLREVVVQDQMPVQLTR